MDSRSVMLFQETNPEAGIDQQKEVGRMSHWQVKRRDDVKAGNGKFFTVTYKEYQNAKISGDWSNVSRKYLSRTSRKHRAPRRTSVTATRAAIGSVGESILEEKSQVFAAYTQLLAHRIKNAKSKQEQTKLNLILNKVVADLAEVTKIPMEI